MGEVNVRGKGRVFKSPVLEALTRTNEYITFFVYVPLTVVLFVLGITHYNVSLGSGLAVFIVGAFSWTLLEYLMHRFLFHWINDNPFMKRLHYIIHGVHHNYPKDEGRLFMPPAPGMILAAVFFSIFYLLMGNYAFAFFPGIAFGWLLYVYMHFAIHKFRRPKSFLGLIWDHHNKHHFKYDDRAFGVSSPLWDLIFGTMPPRKSLKS